MRIIAVSFIFIIFCLFLMLATNDIEISFTMNNNIFEFDSLYIITRINWTKTDTNDYNYLLGIFEGFNDPTFCDSMPIAMIKEENIKESDLNINVTSNIPYKYIRYIFPNNKSSSITPIKIYGYKYIKSNEASQNLFFKPTNLPLIIINTENSIEPTTKDVYINSNIIIVNENNIQINETARIKVRGHSTSSYVKKPFKIKFDKKQKILAFSGKYKNWVLLANYLDKAVLRTSFAFYISRIIGLEYTPRCESVDVILNGNFRGNYMICDQIEVKEGRVEIEEMTPDDITEPNITGGYLLEIDYRAPESGDKYLITNKGLRLGIKYPDSDDITIEQENYIKKYLNDLEERIYNYNLSYIDENSFYKYFLMQEFCADIDTVFSSFHIYKRRNDIKLHFGPVWDYDRAFDNDIRLIPTNLKPKFAFYYGDTSGNAREIFTIILKTTNVIDNISQTWIDLQNNGLNKETLINFIEDKKNLLMESANLNFLRWYKGKIGKGIEEYSNAVDIIVNYINLRFESLTKLIEKARNGDKINGYGALIFIFIFIFIIILIFILI